MAAFTNYDMFVTDIYYLSVNIRDTLTYTLEKFDTDATHFYDRKKRIQSGMQDKSPFAHFIVNNKESGQKISGILDNFMNDVYADDSTIIRIVDGIVAPDSAQFLKVFEYIVGIHETITDICRGYINHGKQNGNSVHSRLDDLFNLGEQFYRSYITVCLLTSLVELYKSFNSAMNEAKGQKNENTNYWNGEINRIVTYLRFVQEKCTAPDAGLQVVFDRVQEAIRFMQGETQPPEGRTIWQEFDDARKSAGSYFSKVLPSWQQASEDVAKLGREYLEKAQSQNPEATA